jgi:hypothetical protein
MWKILKALSQALLENRTPSNNINYEIKKQQQTVCK